uniref:Ubiquitin-like protease family profile domain-containing protein n=1 Tax=Ditylenchus dipsaci TaxID=166011 RepID=A0A915ERG6_9BILA
MKEINWSNNDVVELLQQLKNKKVKYNNVAAYFMEKYNKKCTQKTIYNHLSKEAAVNTYFSQLDFVPLQTKFSNRMIALKETPNIGCGKRSRIAFLHALILLIPKPIFEAFHCDYEKAEMNAATKASGLKKAKLCLFHFSKAILMDKTIAMQQNGYDCGLFLCRFAEIASRLSQVNCVQQDMNRFRSKWLWKWRLERCTKIEIISIVMFI